jgi:hypothetical protein
VSGSKDAVFSRGDNILSLRDCYEHNISTFALGFRLWQAGAKFCVPDSDSTHYFSPFSHPIFIIGLMCLSLQTNSGLADKPSGAVLLTRLSKG